MVKAISLMDGVNSIPCQTVYSIGANKANRYACYSRWAGTERKTTVYFRTHTKSGLTKEELDWFLEKVIPELVTPEYLKACKITELTQDEWKPVSDTVFKTNDWDQYSFDKDVPWIKAVVKPKSDQTRLAWFAFLTFLREPQEYPAHVKAAYRAYKNGLSVSQAWALAYLYQMASNHSVLANPYYNKSFMEDIKKYSLKDRFIECTKTSGRASLNGIFGFTGSQYNMSTRDILTPLLKKGEEWDFVSNAWEAGHTKWILMYKGLLDHDKDFEY